MGKLRHALEEDTADVVNVGLAFQDRIHREDAIDQPPPS
jgi:hypothetical protein